MQNAMLDEAQAGIKIAGRNINNLYMQVKKQQLEPDMEQQTGSKLGKEHIKAVYCHPAYLTYMHSASCEMPNWMKHGK